MEQPSQVSASADHPSPADPAPEVSINLGMEPIIEVEQVSPTVHKISMSPSAKTGKIRNPSKTLLHGSINDPPLLMHATTVDVRSVTPSSTVIANAGPNKIIAKPTQVAVIEAEEHVQCFSARPATSVSVAPSNDKGKGVALAIVENRSLQLPIDTNPPIHKSTWKRYAPPSSTGQARWGHRFKFENCWADLEACRDIIQWSWAGMADGPLWLVISSKLR
ncbi:hypothetical protein ACOSQ2_021117 [Xanthoceras sorbifolium]